MIVLLDTNQDHEEAAAEVGFECGELLTPLTRRRWRGKRYGIDNGAFAKSGFEPNAFMRTVEKMEGERDDCLFVAVPDVVGEAMRTLEMFEHWAPKLRGWPLAFVAQDGIEHVKIPWVEVAAVFIGGGDHFKMSGHAAAVVRTARAMGKWVHVGRINTPERMDRFISLNMDSCDGTGVSRYTHMRTEIKSGLPLLHERT